MAPARTINLRYDVTHSRLIVQAEAYDGDSERRDRIVKNEDVDDDSLKFLLWLVGGVSTVGLAFYFWRRHL